MVKELCYSIWCDCSGTVVKVLCCWMRGAVVAEWLMCCAIGCDGTVVAKWLTCCATVWDVTVFAQWLNCCATVWDGTVVAQWLRCCATAWDGTVVAQWLRSSWSSVICPTTGPKPHAKRFLLIVRSTASSFNSRYPLLSIRLSSNFLLLLPCLLVTSIFPCIFPSIICFRRLFVRKMWPIHFAFRFII